MIHLVRISFLVLLTTISFSHSAAAETPSPKLADDPRVADAVKAWEEWVAYQAAINRFLAYQWASFTIRS